MNRKRAAGSLLVLAAVGCSDSTDVQQPLPSHIEAVAGDEQSGLVGTPLPDSLRVVVTDANGNALPGVAVSWSVASGGGQISPTTSTTNSIGIASAQFILGPSEGDQQAQAEVGGMVVPAVVFTAHAQVQPLVAASVELISGGGQSGAPGTPLLDSLRVRVTDVSGHNVPGVAVNWLVVTGGGDRLTALIHH